MKLPIKCLQNYVNHFFYIYEFHKKMMSRVCVSFLSGISEVRHTILSTLKGLKGQTLSSDKQRKPRVDLAVTQAGLSLRCGHMQH